MYYIIHDICDCWKHNNIPHDNYVKNHCFCYNRVQDIFDWIFEVEGDASGEDPGRIALSVKYKMDTASPEVDLEDSNGVENKLVASIQLQRDNTYQIVPVIKVGAAKYYTLGSNLICKAKNSSYCLLDLHGGFN